MSERPVTRLAALVDELARARRATAPVPRGLPYLGLEHGSGTGFHLLDGLAARGIFRKYELVLDLDAGLGATARWLAARLGCEVVATGSAVEAAAGHDLTRRAGLGPQVRHVAAVATALPVVPARFTHVWLVESLARASDATATLAEAHRALRRGGTLAVQELVLGRGVPPPTAGWRFVSLDERIAALSTAGFVEIDARDRTPEAAERSAQVSAARSRLLAQLRADPALAALAAEREALAAALAAGHLRVAQIVARRP